MKTRKKLFLALAVANLIGGSQSFAWDGSTEGKVQAIEVTQGTNYGFRVWLNPGQQMCANGPNWAYLSDSDSNYKVYVSALLTAKALGSTVRIFTLINGGYCQIHHIAVQ